MRGTAEVLSVLPHAAQVALSVISPSQPEGPGEPRQNGLRMNAAGHGVSTARRPSPKGCLRNRKERCGPLVMPSVCDSATGLEAGWE